MMWHHDWSWWMAFPMGLTTLLVLAVTAWAAVTLLRPRTAGGGHDTPEEILGRRLASGEIAPGEYEERLAALRRNR